MSGWPRAPHGLAFGGDYNPEQWPTDVLEEDVRLMRDAGVNLVSLGIFSWARLEPSPGEYTFGWLDEAMDRLHDAGIAVDLATATASPPAWLARAHPEILPVREDGVTLWPGGRQAWCPSSPVFRQHALELADRLASHYGDHPALVMWHVSNELGCHNAHCYCDTSAAAFRRWLQARYGDLDALNDAWGTAFWSQRYGDWEEILPPRTAPTFRNPTHQLDFRRFSSDELLDHYRAERDVLRRRTPDVPVTTNFMATRFVRDLDYWRWAPEMDLVSNDHYLDAGDRRAHVELAFSADVTRGLAGGEPWMLMEHSTSAVNWQHVNVAKGPGEMARNALQHVARGSDAVLYFQWRASRAGAEKFHSALVPHAGTDTRLWREVVELGATLERLAAVRGSRVRSRVALVYSWESWWAAEMGSQPTAELRYRERAEALHRACYDRGVTLDVVAPGTDLDGYDLVLVPTLYLVDDDGVAAIAAAAERGATVLVTYFSGIVDEHDHIRLGGYPGAFRDLLGIRVEEFRPLRPGESVDLDDGSTADLWTEDLRLEGAEAIASIVTAPLKGVPAVTRHGVGRGAAWYVATRLADDAEDRLVGRLLDEAGIAPPVAVPRGVEVVERHAEDGTRYLFVINHLDRDATVAVSGHELTEDRAVDGTLAVAAGDVAVVRR